MSWSTNLICSVFLPADWDNMEDQAYQMTGLVGQMRGDLGGPDDTRKHHNNDLPQQDIGHILQQMRVWMRPRPGNNRGGNLIKEGE